eukprot:COSAG03_NODE_12102_length_561_cov_0.826840_1_plen_47_part_10
MPGNRSVLYQENSGTMATSGAPMTCMRQRDTSREAEKQRDRAGGGGG